MNDLINLLAEAQELVETLDSNLEQLEKHEKTFKELPELCGRLRSIERKIIWHRITLVDFLVRSLHELGLGDQKKWTASVLHEGTITFNNVYKDGKNEGRVRLRTHLLVPNDYFRNPERIPMNASGQPLWFTFSVEAMEILASYIAINKGKYSPAVEELRKLFDEVIPLKEELATAK